MGRAGSDGGGGPAAMDPVRSFERWKKKYTRRTRRLRLQRKERKRPEWQVERESIGRLVQRYPEINASEIQRFSDFPLSKKTLKGLQEAQYRMVTEIQRQTIGLALQGKDVLGAAKTGSGKTLAFIVPALELLYRHQWTSADGLGVLVISPTRELAYQTFKVLRKVGRNHEFSAGLIIGGKDLKEESERIHNINMLICTPGRLLQHMDETSYFYASDLQMLVLDEADRILDMGFADTMNAIIENLPKKRQTLLFSATQTKSVKDLARLSLKDPEYVWVHEKAKFSTPATLDQNYVVCELQQKVNMLYSFLRSHLKKKSIVFFASCKEASNCRERGAGRQKNGAWGRGESKEKRAAAWGRKGEGRRGEGRRKKGKGKEEREEKRERKRREEKRERRQKGREGKRERRQKEAETVLGQKRKTKEQTGCEMALLLWLGSQLSSCWSNISVLGVFLMVFTLLLDFMKRRKKWSHYPPGPVSLPFIGTMLCVDFHNPHLSFNQLHKKFGNVFNLQNCWSNLVVLNGYKTVKEALIHRSEDFADRPYFPVYEHLGYGNKSEGIVMARYGHVWKELRKFTLSTLRNFGMGKKSLEERVTEEVGFLCSAVNSEEGRPFDLRFLVNNAVCNVICTTVYGERFDYGDETFKKLLDLFENSLNEEAGFLPQLLNEIPILLRIPGVPQKVFRGQKAFMDFIDVLIDKHMETWNPAYIRDFTDAFLKEMEKGKVAEENGFSYNNLRLVTADLFAAGSETTATTLRWAFLYMLLHPEIQSKVQAEIDKVIGRERSPTMKDQASMPYTNAVIHEVQRYGDVIPIGLPHMTYRDTELQGFFIPKGTTIITNLSSVLKDEAVWEKPNEFYPEHFLDANGQFVKPEAFLPFSAGRRACLGEQLAKTELFIFFTSLLQKFTFVLPEDQPRPREDGHFALTSSPHPYLVRAVPR